MALHPYITPADVTNKIFKKFNDTTQEMYCDRANDELEDLAIRKGVDPVDILMPIHFKLLQYAMHYAVSQLAQDNAGFNSKDGFGSEDIYEVLFKREQYLIQNIKQGITEVMFTGETQTPDNRAVRSQRIVRG